MNETSTVAQVLKNLDENKISSIPLTRASSPASIIGIVDILDLVTSCTAKLDAPILTESIAKREIEQFLNKKAIDVVEMSARNIWQEISERALLLDMLALLSHPNIHRLAVIDDNKKVIALITQTDVVQFLFQNRTRLGDIISSPIKSWSQVKHVESIEVNDTLADSFRIMWEHEISGVAVVDKDGSLVGNISASDIKISHTCEDMLKNLFDPIHQFLGLETEKNETELKPRSSSLSSSTSRAHGESKCLNMEDTLENVLEAIVDNHIHRVFLVDNEKKPIGVISLSDIIMLFKTNNVNTKSSK